ncbi:Panacea domain-containing protein [Microbulbifer sp. 2201CG32-9]|uniref:Panacea domain-containing protein n=1 Tax=Microbulbifer sp. 2201CG32-9 TaxID=3232309 RepID=UPI00345B92BD
MGNHAANESRSHEERGHYLTSEMSIPICSAHIANFFLDRAKTAGESLTMLKLMKLVAIAYGWALAALGRDILDGEGLEAWKFGPVVASLYHEFKGYGPRPITHRAVEFELMEMEDGSLASKMLTPSIPDDDEDLLFILNYVWEVYRQYSAFDLVDMTHQPETPWAVTYKPNSKYEKIPDNLIKEHYKKFIQDVIVKEDNSAGARPAA